MSMMNQKHWLEKFSWDVIVEMNRQACQAGKVVHEPKPEGHDQTRATWETAMGREQTFREAVEVCRECHRLAPFRYFNGNTFAGIARVLSQEVCKGMGPTKALMFRNAVGHYVAGVIGSEEFDQVSGRIMAEQK